MLFRSRCKFGATCQYSHDGALKAGVCTTDIQDDQDGTDHAEGSECVEFECADGDEPLGIVTDSDRAEECGEQVAAICGRAGVSEWVVDTGSENHLIGRSRIDPEDSEPYKIERPLRLATANGTIVVDQRVKKEVAELGVELDPLVLSSTVDALSVGRLVMDDRFSFHWQHGERAYFIDPSGKIIHCNTRGYVPVIPGDIGGGESDFALPGVENEGCQEDPDARAGENECELTRDEKLKREAASAEHSLTHRPKNPFCWVCGLSKMSAKQARRIGPDDHSVNPTCFGEHVCADHITGLYDEAEGIGGHHAALLIVDLYTRFTDLAPVKDKSAESALRAMKYYLGNYELERLYTDNSKELEVVGNEIANVHQTSTPHRPQSNSIVERAIRTMVEGTRAALLQAGLPHRFWPLAGRHHTFATAISDHPDGQPSPYWLKNGKEFDGWRLPFGSLVHYRPPRPVLKSLMKFEPTTLPAIFVGWHLEPGCEWRGDYLVIPLSAFKVPGRKMFNVHRIKELVSFDAMHFPLQAAKIEEMVGVKCPPQKGDAVWPDEDKDDAEPIDKHFKDLVGDDPPSGMSFEEKYRRVALELFGPSEGDNNEGVGEAEDKTPKEEAGDQKNFPFNPRAKRIILPRFTGERALGDRSTKESGDRADEEDKKFMAMVAECREVPSPVARKKITQPSDRRLIEYCCSDDSVLGREKYVRAGCHCVRLTIKTDLTTEDGLKFALGCVRDTPDSHHLHLWASIPCTAGSPWQRVNQRHESARELMTRHLETFEALMKNLRTVAREVISRGGDLSFEWPTGCSLWNHDLVVNFLEEFALNKVDFHGCAAGLKSSKTNQPIKKPWTVASTSPAVTKALGRFRCPGKDEHPAHEPCAGIETKRTELYTQQMADAVHRAIKDEALSHRAASAVVDVGGVRGEHDDAEDEIGDIPDPSGHRPKMGPEGLWCAMITKTLHPSDPLCRHPKGIKAIQDELADLREKRTWDEENPREAAEVARDMPEADFARIFPILGTKHFEDVEMQK